MISKWIRESQLGDLLRQVGFLDSNVPEKYGLNTVQDEILLSLKQRYLNMFKDGVWHYTRTRVDAANNIAERRLYLVGGIAPGSPRSNRSYAREGGFGTR